MQGRYTQETAATQLYLKKTMTRGAKHDFINGSKYQTISITYKVLNNINRTEQKYIAHINNQPDATQRYNKL